jgi:hypothetical protein
LVPEKISPSVASEAGGEVVDTSRPREAEEPVQLVPAATVALQSVAVPAVEPSSPIPR